MQETPMISRKTALWMPAVFCAVLSLLKVFSPGSAGDPAFYAFLPVCFLFTGFVQVALLRRVELLETALRERTGQAGTQPGESASTPA